MDSLIVFVPPRVTKIASIRRRGQGVEIDADFEADLLKIKPKAQFLFLSRIKTSGGGLEVSKA